MDTLAFQIRKPDDWHVHLRHDQILRSVAKHTSRVFERALIMGNLTPPIVTAQDMIDYRQEIKKHTGRNFQPLMTVMLTKRTTPAILTEAHAARAVALKWIPGGTSTGSDDGVSMEDIERYYPVLTKAEEMGMVLSGHWEQLRDKNGREIHEFLRETEAIRTLTKIINDFPLLKIVVEHITTAEMVEFVQEAPANVVATITAHHLVLTYADVKKPNEPINPWCYCKPIAKRPKDQETLVKAALSGNRKFFFGSDSAPHPESSKTATPPAAGIFVPGKVAIAILTSIFEEVKMLDKLENFTSRFGAEFYGFPLNTKTITIYKQPWEVPEWYKPVGVFMGGQTLDWQVAQ